MLTHEASLGEDAATSTGTQITAHASANTLGNWVQLGADTTRDGFLIGASFTSVLQGQAHLVDIGIDPAGGSSYTAVVQQMAVAVANTTASPGLQFTYFQLGAIFVPAGSAVAACTRCSTGGGTLDVRALLMAGAPDSALNWVETLGAVTADSGGTSIDPGGTANTKGNWVTLSASTSYDISAFSLSVNSDQAATVQNDAEGFIDIAIEVAGVQYVIAANLPFIQYGSRHSSAPRVLIPASIPKGSKVVARAQSSTAAATRRLFDLSMLGFNRYPLRAN